MTIARRITQITDIDRPLTSIRENRGHRNKRAVRHMARLMPLRLDGKKI